MIPEYLNIIIYYYLQQIYESFHHIEMITDNDGKIVSIHMAKDSETFKKSINQLKKENESWKK